MFTDKSKVKLGTRVEILHGAWKGLQGTVISRTRIILDERGRPKGAHTGSGGIKKSSIGYLQPVNWSKDIAVLWDNGQYDVIPKRYVKSVRKNARKS